ncbi:M20/M25/M40 family metallo-hydrolase [Alicyclobacillus sp. ALC3]|uniref:M20/M25/M40 family metallo-hydrolase n=1 Tax=Alicyclobacillus sp. ALC3 TaxID=2796143 RepID=UPI002379BB6E|nr:M20/M25/M40 family metallo-hydrolase [Alicyclobacillus sp. ALC3]WDL98243.1 M20/M25/M40 family metallo-hydrolase [Alicyclobacillus sp. ALC3]
MYEATRQLTLDLVAMPSVNGTPGESAIVEYLHHRLMRHSAYRAGYMKLFLVPAVDDPLFRPVLIAHMSARSRNRTADSQARRGVLLFGHTDTVGTSDFGALESLAFRPLELTEEVKSGVFGAVAAQRARSGKWLFGRGVLDMKSGVAAALTAFEALAEQGPETDVFFSATPDEEVGSLGVKTLAAWLRDYLPAEGIALQAAINTDYTSWQAGDGGARHIYLGSIGKLLPAVYVRGVPSHAAEPHNGLDPNLVVAAITNRVVYNKALCDEDDGELSPYPVCLHQRDDKPGYDVQTALSASAYYNLFHMQKSPAEQLELFFETVRLAVTDVQESHPDVVAADIPVLTFQDLWEEVGQATQSEVRTFADSLTLSQDLRERCRLITEHLLHKSGRSGPAVVVYFANGLVPKVNSGILVRNRLTTALATFTGETGETFALHRYFPYISDLSFLTPSPDWDDPAFRRNFPSLYTASPAPLRALPVLMVGTYGTGAHQPDECVDAEYTFGRLPVLLAWLSQRLAAD